MKLLKKIKPIFFAGLMSMTFFAQAEEKQCLTIHIPQESPVAFKQAINIANNLPKQLGEGVVDVEILAQGPGLKLLTKGSPETDRISSLIEQGKSTMDGGTKFKACAATIAGIKKRTGKEPVLIDGVEITYPGAVARVLENHKRGCAYIRI